MTSEVQIFGKDKIKLNILQDILGGMIKVGFQLNNEPVQDMQPRFILMEKE